MIEYRKIHPPVEVPANGPYDATIADLVDKTPQGRLLFAGVYEYPLPVAKKVGVLKILRTGHGLLRVIPERTKLRDVIDEVDTLHLNQPGDRHVLMDAVPGDPDKRVITNLFIYRRDIPLGSGPERKPGHRAQRAA